MDNHHLRAILLKLQDRLSDNDRKRLHFFLGNDIPRRIRDDPSLSGTLSLMESLFDQDKISEYDFTFLINAFTEIQCIDAAKVLTEHMKRLQPNATLRPMQSLTSIMPPMLNQLFEDQEDTFPTNKRTLLIKAGQKFGGTGGSLFDDSSTKNFTCSHYLSRIIIRNDNDDDGMPLDWIQFIYSSSYDQNSVIEGQTHGFRRTSEVSQFLLEKDERIYKIRGKLSNVTLSSQDGTLFSTILVRGLQFFTSKGRASRSYDHLEGKVFTEEYDGYTLGYATGRSGLFIDQLQFYWYRTVVTQ
ncbi:unnamed protein product [Rotaria sp. Silwood1]|nr:unnamed protein product [Rotaria sp. Silwood1]CAF1228717.1 unnamed protein product [Rotaria sp. Silwood1]